MSRVHKVFAFSETWCLQWVMREALEKAISAVDGLSELARRLEVTPQTVVNWRKRGIPPRRVLDVERATVGANGQPAVTRHELRPDIYPTEPVR